MRNYKPTKYEKWDKFPEISNLPELNQENRKFEQTDYKQRN